MWLKLSLLDLSGSDPDTLGLCGLEFPVLGCSNRAWFLWTASECTFHALSCDCMPAFGRRARDAKALSGLLVQQAFHRVRLRGTISSFLRCEMAFTFFSCSHVCVCTALSSGLVQHASCSASVSLYQLLRSFWGVQCNPLNLFSCTQLLSKMMKYVFMQLISSSATSSKVIQGCLKQNYGPFSCSNTCSMELNFLLHLFNFILEGAAAVPFFILFDGSLCSRPLAKRGGKAEGVVFNHPCCLFRRELSGSSAAAAIPPGEFRPV